MTRTAIGRLENPRFGMGRMAIARHMRLYTSTRYKTTIKKKKKKNPATVSGSRDSTRQATFAFALMVPYPIEVAANVLV